MKRSKALSDFLLIALASSATSGTCTQNRRGVFRRFSAFSADSESVVRMGARSVYFN